MNLPVDIQLIGTATGEGDSLSLSPQRLPLVQTEPLADPLASLCLRLAATLIQELSSSSRESLGLILVTRYGCLRTDMDFDRSRREVAGRYASPAAFRGTLPSTVPAEISVRLGIKGPLLTLCAPENTPPIDLALHRASAWMRHLQLEFCLAGAFDWPIKKLPQAKMMLLHHHRP